MPARGVATKTQRYQTPEESCGRPGSVSRTAVNVAKTEMSATDLVLAMRSRLAHSDLYQFSLRESTLARATRIVRDELVGQDPMNPMPAILEKLAATY
jgi:hypothetical protein